jgi:hypothetical protein
MPTREPCLHSPCAGTLDDDGTCSLCGRGSDAAVAPEDRVPCPDGTCIGIVGPDGRCTECGAEADPGGPAGSGDDPDDGWSQAWDAGGGGDDRDADDADDEDAGAGDDEERLPCPDGTCIGIIGPDGRCTECGLEADDGAEPTP